MDTFSHELWINSAIQAAWNQAQTQCTRHERYGSLWCNQQRENQQYKAGVFLRGPPSATTRSGRRVSDKSPVQGSGQVEISDTRNQDASAIWWQCSLSAREEIWAWGSPERNIVSSVTCMPGQFLPLVLVSGSHALFSCFFVPCNLCMFLISDIQTDFRNPKISGKHCIHLLQQGSSLGVRDLGIVHGKLGEDIWRLRTSGIFWNLPDVITCHNMSYSNNVMTTNISNVQKASKNIQNVPKVHKALTVGSTLGFGMSKERSPPTSARVNHPWSSE